MTSARTWLAPFVLVWIHALPPSSGQAVTRSGSRPFVARETSIRDGLGCREYAFGPLSARTGVWSAPNRAQGLRSRVGCAGLEVFPRTTSADGAGAPWILGLRTRALRRGERAIELATPSVSVDGASATIDHGPVEEWVHNRPSGIEQTWILASRPAGGGPLVIELELAGFTAEIDGTGRSARLVGPEVTLPYRSLRALDAGGGDVPAQLVPARAGIAIEVEDGSALYPLTIDPTLTWTEEGDQAV